MSQEPREPTKTQSEAPYNAGDPVAIRRQQDKIKEMERRRINGLKAIVDNPDSRVWLWNLLEFCGIARISFTGNSETFFLEGGRNVGLKIQADLTRHFPESYIGMMRDNENEQQRGWRSTSKAASKADPA